MNPGAPLNPFVTRHLALPFCERAGEPPGAPARLLDQALRLRLGEIIGPEGTGKTTLLRALLAEATARRIPAALIRVPNRQRWPTSSVWKFCRSHARLPAPGALLLLDSAEQLVAPARWLLRAACRAHGVALVVTGHAPLGLPSLRLTAVDDELFARLTSAILARSPEAPALVSAAEAPEALRLAAGNAREALFALYDRYEQRWPRITPPG